MKVAVRIEKLGSRIERAAGKIREVARSGAGCRLHGAVQARSIQNDEVSDDVVQPGSADRDFQRAQQ